MGIDVSVTERQDFLRCRRKWDLTSWSRQKLRKVGSPATELHVGALVHEGLQFHVKFGEKWLQHWAPMVQELETDLQVEYQKIVGASMSYEELNILDEARELAKTLLIRYFQHWGPEPLGSKFEYVASEISFRVNLPGTDHHIIGTFDGLARHIESREIFVVEHKTYSMKPDRNRLMMNDQFVGYLWAASMITKRPVTKLIYDGIGKKLPTIPRELKAGGLSKAKIVTDMKTYLGEIRRLRLRTVDYTDVLARLDAQDEKKAETPFYSRWVLDFGLPQLEAYERDATAVVKDMANPNLALYPTFTWQGCWDCNVTDLCMALQYGDSLDSLISTRYTTAKPRRTEEAQQIPVTDISHLLGE